MSGKYCILTFKSKVTDSIIKDFTSNPEKIGDIIKSYSSHYLVTDIKYCNLETYLNKRLDYVVEEFNESCKYVDDTLDRMKKAECSLKVGIDTLSCIYENMIVAKKRIVMLINRLLREGLDIENEEAIIIYDMTSTEEVGIRKRGLR